MADEEVLLLACGTWGGAVVERLDHADPAAARLVRRLHVLPTESDTTGASAQRLGLLLPSADAFRNQLMSSDARRLGTLAPAAWLADVKGGLLASGNLDERYRHRLAVLASEPRIRRRLGEVGKGCGHVLVVGAPDEPMASAALVLLSSWARCSAEGDATPTVTLLLGLDPLGADAARDPHAAARLHAFLAELDRVRDGGTGPDGRGDPFRDILVLGRSGLHRDAMTLAAGELAAWWIRGGSTLRDAVHAGGQRARVRGRRQVWHAALPATASIALDDVVQAQALQIATAATRKIVGPREEPARELAQHSQRLADDIRRVAGVPSDTDVDLARSEGAAAVDASLASRARVDRALQRIAEQEAEARSRGRAALFGGAIQRVHGTVASGFLDEQVAWAWKLMLAGRATLDDVISTLSAASLDLGTSRVAKISKDFERIAGEASERAERRRREGAPSASVAQAHAHVLRAAAVRSRCDAAVSVLTEAAEALGRIIVALTGVPVGLAGLSRLAAQTSVAVTSPWHAAVPLDHRGLQRLVFGSDDVAAAWLADVAASAPGDPAHGLARGPDALMEHLRSWCSLRIDEALVKHPVGELKGLEPWLASFLAAVPAPTAIDSDAPAGEIPRAGSFLFATAGTAPRLAAALPRASQQLPGADAARIGWLSLTGPLPMLALAGLDSTRQALDEAAAAGRLLPMEWERDAHDADERRFHEPVQGDLAWRARRALERSGRTRSISPDVLGRLDSRVWPEILPAIAALRALPRDLPALRQLAVLGEWSSFVQVEQLAGLERGAQEVDAALEPDGTDAELLDVVRATSATADPVKKWMESGHAAQGLAYLQQAQGALDAARSLAEARLAGLERVVLRSLLAGWRDLVAARIAALRGRSDLAVRLRTHRLVVQAHATLLVEVENRGQHPATSARIELLDSAEFRVLGSSSHDIGEMAPGARHVVEIRLKPARPGALAVELSLAWDDLEAAGKASRAREIVEFITELPPFRRIERNPYIAGPPVRSEAMFFGREDIFTFIAESLAGRHQDNILILHGQRRTGKSSILCQLERRDMLPDHLPVLVDLQGLGGFDTAGLLYQLARHAARRLARVMDPAPPLPDRAAFQAAPYDAFQEHFDDVEDALAGAGKRLLFMIDEFDALEGRVEGGHVAREVFPFLRNLMQHRERVAFLLAGTQQLVDMRHDYWSILFSLASYRHVSCLPAEAARELIQKPLEGEVIFDDLVIESLLRLTAGHPYYLQLACQSVVQRLNHSATHACVMPEDLHAVLPEVLAAGGGHFEHEWRTLPSDVGRAALVAMADCDDTGMPWFATSDLAAMLGSRTHADRSAADGLPEALAQLASREILEESPGRGAWRIRIDLLRHWIRRQHPPERLAAATSGAGA